MFNIKYIIRLEKHLPDGDVNRFFYSPHNKSGIWSSKYENSLLFETEKAATQEMKDLQLIDSDMYRYSIIPITSRLEDNLEEYCWVTGQYRDGCDCMICNHQATCPGSDIEVI